MLRLSTVAFLLLILDERGVVTNPVLDTSLKICGSKEAVILEESGEESSRTIHLGSEEVHEMPCTLNVKAAKSHVVHLQFLETNLEIHRALSNGKKPKHPPCMLRIYVRENETVPIWQGDLCNIDNLPYVDLLTPQITLSWDPPEDTHHSKGRKILLTTVGQKEVCKKPDQHTCTRIGFEPILCVSDRLLCDGRHDCPKNSTTSDEDETFCKAHLLAQNSWQRIAADIIKKLKLENNMNKRLEQRESQFGTSTDSTTGTTGRRKMVIWKNRKKIRIEVTTKPAPNDSQTSLAYTNEQNTVLDTSLKICGSKEAVILEENGEESSRTIHLGSEEEVHEIPCTLNVKAPKSHVIHLQFLETNLEIHRALSNGKKPKHPPCMLRIYVRENETVPIWQGDLCSIDNLPYVDLLTPQITLSWDPPEDTHHSKGRKILLTTVGQKEVCKKPDQHTCMRIGFEPILCVSDRLLCDGRHDCPKGSTTSDEDETFCKAHLLAQNSWQRIAADIIKKLKLENNMNKWLEQHESQFGTSTDSTTGTTGRKKMVIWKDWKEIRIEVTTKPAPNDSQTSLGALLSQYGPWGYLLLGMLLCGSLLIFCGLWECCVRRQKNQPSPPSSPTAVRVVDGYDEAQPGYPPEYEELDLPPSYTVLFPSEAKSTEDLNADSDVDGEHDAGRELIPLNNVDVYSYSPPSGSDDH